MPKDLPTGDTSEVKNAILDQKVKLYVTKEAEIKYNIFKMYEKIGGNVMMPYKALLHMIMYTKKRNKVRTLYGC